MIEADFIPFQNTLVERQADSDRLFVAVDMGLGKTLCSIAAADKRRARRIHVSCPAIGLVSWPAELGKWYPQARWYVVADPDMMPSPDDLPLGDEPVYVFTPYSEIQRRPAAWVAAAQRFNADVCILDEAHYLSHLTSARAQAVYGYRCDLVRSIARSDQAIWPLSGTPAPNFTSELWPHLHALAPEMIRHPIHGYPMSEEQFKERFSTQRASFNGMHVTGSVNTPLLRSMTNDFFHRVRKSEVRAEMPPILWTTEPLPISAATASYHLDFPEGLDDAGLLNWLRTAYPSGSSERKATGLAKIAGGVEWARHFLENSDRKLILFAWHREVVAALHAALGPDFGSVCITGDTPLKVRMAAVAEFQSKTPGSARVFNGQMLAAGTTITLTEASDVAFLEDDWTPGTLEQAAARADRLGQTRGVVARILYVPGTKDEAVAKARVRKARDFDLMFN